MNSLNLVLIPGARLGDHLGTWTRCIFIDHFESNYVNPIIHNLSLIYQRYIDDIIFIWTTEKHLLKYLKELNVKYKSIKFDYQYSQSSISFLDTEIYINKNKLYTKICRQKTDLKTAFTWILDIKNHLRKVYHTAKPSELKGFALIQSNTSNTAKYSRKLSRKGM